MYEAESREATSVDLDKDNGTQWSALRRYAVPFALAAILLLGAVFRFIGINWDDQQHLHPDERFLTMVESALVMPWSSDIGGKLPDNCTHWGGYFDTACSPLNPYNRGFGNFFYGTFPIFVVKAVGDFLDQSGYDQIYIVGRYLSGLFDLFTVLMVFFIGRRLYGTRVGLLAALLLTASVLDIQQSHYFTVDTYSNVPIVLGFWFALDIAQGRRGVLAYLLAGVFFGLALASRINLLPFAAIIALAGFYRFAQEVRKGKAQPADRPDPVAARSFAFAAESVGGTEDAGTAAGSTSAMSARNLNLGPLSFEVQARRRQGGAPPADEALEDSYAPAWWESVAVIGLQLALAALAALITFRIANPYAFLGLGLNPKFVSDMNWARDNVAGVIDTPPMDQWTARPDYWFPFAFMVQWGMGPGLGLAAWLGFALAGFELFVRRQWQHLLAFFWVGGLFLYMGQQVAKTDRYYLPLYPFLALFAAYLCVKLAENARSWWDRRDALAAPVQGIRSTLASLDNPLIRKAGAVLAGVAIVAAVGYTLFWAAAFTSIYTRPVTRVTASRWIFQNVPPGAVFGNETWDDPIPLRVDGKDPFGGMYSGVELQWYNDDTPEKREQAINWLDSVSYVNLTSNRLYLSIPRLPLRYPLTIKYYEWLFDGKLGFQLVQTVTSRPQFLGIEINDDNAEETFTVYDHPKVLIFKKTAAYSHDNTVKLFNSVDLSEVIHQKPVDATISHNAFQLSPTDAAANRAGGTWSDIFSPDSFVNQIPVIAWLVLLEVLGMVMFPLAFLVLRRFDDRGYGLAKVLGVLALGWGAWMLSGLRLVPFSRESILGVFLALVVLGVLLAVRQWRELVAFFRTRFTIVLIEELVFIGFFLLSLLIRYGNPDLWHPSFGGEKPMDFAYLNAIIKTTWFPPYDPWFSGGYINYYYFGQILSATLVKFTGILPEVAYNLLLPMFFSFTALGAFVVAYNLVHAIFSARQVDTKQMTRRSWAAGLFAAILVLIIGNLGEVGVLTGALMKLGGGSGPGALVSGLIAWLVDRRPFPISTGDWYWIPTRVIPDTINEFPFFTFLYADLHAHLMALALTLVALAFAVHAVLVRGRLKWYDLVVAALVLGALRATNTWDYPTYLAALGAALVIGYLADARAQEASNVAAERWLDYLVFGVLLFIQILIVVVPINALGIKITIDVLILGLIVVFGMVMGWARQGRAFDPRSFGITVGWRMAALVALSAYLYYPYLAYYGAAYTSVELWTGSRTTLTEFLTVHGIFLFMVTTFLVLAYVHPWRRAQPSAEPEAATEGSSDWSVYIIAGVFVLAVLMLMMNQVVFAVVLPLVTLGLWLLFRREAFPEERLLALLALAALGMLAMVEVITLKGDVGRMNTVFKFYLQAWVLMSIVSASGLALVWDHLAFKRQAKPVEPVASTEEAPSPASGALVDTSFLAGFQLKQVWWGAFALLLLAGMLYPIFATWAKVNDRYIDGSPAGLNGIDYMLNATYSEKNQTFPLAPDHAAILWIRQNIKGSPVIAEGNAGLYHWGDRISINTGLPTVIGWDWHTKQQYALLDGSIIDNRVAALNDFYNTPDPTDAAAFINRFNVSYIYVGPMERVLYDATGLSKFEAMTSVGALSKVYDRDGVEIYQVNSQALAVAP